MIRGLSTVLISGTFVLSFVNAALAGGGTVGILEQIHKTGRCFQPGISQHSHLGATSMKCPEFARRNKRPEDRFSARPAVAKSRTAGGAGGAINIQ